MDSATPARPMVNVATGGTASDSAGNATQAKRAFDRNSLSQWLYVGTTGWLQYDLGHTERVQRYAITSTTNPVPRDPKDWQLQASNDGVTWTTLDTQNDQVFDYRLELKTYAIANPASYRYYRLNITANNGDSTLTDLSELGLFRFQVAVVNPMRDGRARPWHISSSSKQYAKKCHRFQEK